MENRESFDRSSSEDAHGSSGHNNDGNHPEGTLPHVEEQDARNKTIQPPSAALSHEHSEDVKIVLQSDIGVTTLLNRLKQSIASAREFATFLKKRSTLEEEHAQGLRKICKTSYDSTKRPEGRQGSYGQSYVELLRIHERMVENGVQFGLSLHQMQEDLGDLAANMERGRKHWKQAGLSAEKRVQDSESMMEKAKAKYDSLAEDYDRARTGDKQSGRVFGLKGPKSAAQHEEDLHRKVHSADADYSSKVQTLQSQHQELINILRPQAVRALEDLILECDSGLTLQLQKFASFNEKLLLGNGLCVSPLKGHLNNQETSARSLRDIIFQVDNEQDLNNYIASFATNVGSKNSDIRYERHPSLAVPQQIPPPSIQQVHTPGNQQTQPIYNPHSQPDPSSPQYGNNLNQGPQGSSNPAAIQKSYPSSPQQQHPISPSLGGPPQLPPQQTVSTGQPTIAVANNPLPFTSQYNNSHAVDLPPLKPVFGVSLDGLYKRDGTAVPMVVYQCLQAVELYGLEVEGIYRLSGNASHISRLKSVFDHDDSKVDFRNPENFFHDVNSVAGLLKQFFRELPEPLLTNENYMGFIEAAHIDDDTTRRDSLHAIINSLPDPNYATLQVLTLHLNRVQEHSSTNRMNAGNLAICFGPTLMGSNTGPNIADAGWQVRVIDTILQNTYQIFDED